MTRASPRSHPQARRRRLAASARGPVAGAICRYRAQEPRHADDLHHLRAARAALGARRRRPRRSADSIRRRALRGAPVRCRRCRPSVRSSNARSRCCSAAAGCRTRRCASSSGSTTRRSRRCARSSSACSRAADDDGRVLVARAARPARPRPAGAACAARRPRRRRAGEPRARGPAHLRPALRSRREPAARRARRGRTAPSSATRFHAICGEVAGRLGGHVLPWVSDGVAIFFGHPRAQDDDALRAVRCGWEILRTLAAAREVVEREFGLRLDGAAGDRHRAERRRPRRRRAVRRRAARSRAPSRPRRAPDRVTVDEATRARAAAAFGFEPAAGARALRGDRPAAIRPLAPHAAPPLVGRTGERALLQALAERAAGGTRSAVLVRGEAGIGKTRLLEQLGAERRRGPRDGRHALRLQPLSPRQRAVSRARRAAPPGSWTAAMPRPASRRAPRTCPAVSAPWRCSPACSAWRRPTAGDGALPIGPARRRRESLAALADALARRGHRAPLLLVVEDLHWADASTLELVATLLDGPRELALMLALTARSEFAGLPQRTLQHIELGRLDARGEPAARRARRRRRDAARRRGRRAGAGGGRLAAARRGAHAHRARHAGRRTARRRDALRLPDGAPGSRRGGPRRRPARRDDRARVRPHAARRRRHDRAGRARLGPRAARRRGRRRAGRARSLRVLPLAAAGGGAQLAAKARAAQPQPADRARAARAVPARRRRRARARSRATSSTPARCARRCRHWQRAGRQALGRPRAARGRACTSSARSSSTRARPTAPTAAATELELRVLAGDAIAAHAGRRTRPPPSPITRAPNGSAPPSRCPPSASTACCALTAHRVLDGRPADAQRLALALLAVAEAAGADPALLPEAECEVGGALVACGRHREALGHLARAVELCAGAAPQRRRGALRPRPGGDRARPPRRRARVPRRSRGRPLRPRDRHGAAERSPPRAERGRRRVRRGDRGARPRRSRRGPVRVGAGDRRRHRGGPPRAAGAGAGAARLGARAGRLARRRPRRAAGAIAAWTATGAGAGGPFVHGLLADALAHTGEPGAGITALDAGAVLGRRRRALV